MCVGLRACMYMCVCPRVLHESVPSGVPWREGVSSSRESRSFNHGCSRASSETPAQCFQSGRVAVRKAGPDAGEEGLEAFEYLLACGARYNQQAWKELGALPPAPSDQSISAGDTLSHSHTGRW